MPRFSAADFLAQTRRTPLLPVFYHTAAAEARAVLGACYQGGLRVYEYTNRGPEALAIFTELQRFVEAEMPDLLLGAGTIFRADDAERFIAAGADFVVSPVLDAAVGAVCQRHGLAWLPGAFTLNEVYAAAQAGATVVKLFPASALAPSYVRTLRGPLPDVPLLVSGGVEATAEALAGWFGAGATCVSVGAQLLAAGGVAGLPAHVAALRAGVSTEA